MAKGIISIWIDSDTPESLGNKVIKDDVEIATVPNGVQEYKDPDVVVNRQYKYVIQSYTATSQSTDEVLGTNLNYYTIVEATGLKPIMTKFRVEDANKDRIYFDTPLGPVTGLTDQGFTISGNTISDLNTTDNYFTVGTTFTFWDNSQIRLESGNGVVYDFTLEHIDNNILQPLAGTVRYVTTDATGSGNGQTEGTAWNTTQASNASNIAQGMTINIKAGTYTAGITVPETGGVNAPIVYSGYKVTPGDLDGVEMYYTYGDGALDPSEMPLINLGNRQGTESCFYTENYDYIILRNLQFQEAQFGARMLSGTGLQVDNCISRTMGNTTVSNGNGYGYQFGGSRGCTKFRCTNTFQENATLSGYTWAGKYALIDNVKSYSNEDGSAASQDYYFNISSPTGTSIPEDFWGGYITIRNSYAKRDGDVFEKGHGCSIGNFTEAHEIYYVLADNCTFVNLIKNGEFRHGGAHHNVIKRSRGYLEGDGSIRCTGSWFRDGAHDNICEQNHFDIGSNGAAVWFFESGEIQANTNNNIIRNNIFDGKGNALSALRYENTSGTAATISGNKFYNNTFYNFPVWATHVEGSGITVSNEEVKGNLIDHVNAIGTSEGYTFSDNNFNESWTTGIGTGDTNIDPEFADLINFQPTVLINMDKIDGINYDKDGNERQDPTTVGSVLSTEEI